MAAQDQSRWQVADVTPSRPTVHVGRWLTPAVPVHASFRRPGNPSSGKYWIPIAVLLLAIASLGMLVGTHTIRDRLMQHDSELLHALSLYTTDVSTAHLWLEEYISGDGSIVLDKLLWPNLKCARALLDFMLQGGQFPLSGRITTSPLTHPSLRALAEQLEAAFTLFADLTKERYQGHLQGEDVGIGSPLDERYDQVFFRMFQIVERLRTGLEARLDVNQTRVRVLVKIIMLTWVGMVLLALAGLWYHERRRGRAEQALQQSQQQLMQAQRMEAVGSLAGGLAHDINNYLGAITGSCEMVKMAVDANSLIATKMDLALSTAFKAAALIRRLLAFSHMQPHHVEIINLSKIVGGLQEMVGRLLGEDIQFITRLAPDLWAVKGDRSQIEQVIVNLLVNAREAMPTGGVIVIETVNVQADIRGPTGEGWIKGGDYVSLVVHDTGNGIPLDIQGKIFEPFFTTKEEKGSGLGLATVYGIVQQSGGMIVVDSEVGRGSTFTVYLPRTTAQPDTPPSDIHPAVQGGSECLLLVEDNPELRATLMTVLKTAGYDVFTASNGEEALAIFERQSDEIALVIADVVMPGMSGVAIASHIETCKPHLPILFMSGYTDNVVLRHGIRGTDVNFLQKPFTAGILTQKVREILSRT